MNGKLKFTLYFIFITLLIGLDQFTKFLATSKLEGKDPYVILDGILEFNFLEGGNKGAAWGILSGQIGFFIFMTIIVCFFVVLVMFRIEKLISNDIMVTGKLNLLQFVFAVLIAGAIGNFIDRAFRGFVIDFIYFKLIDFPTFNVADCYVTCSTIGLLIMCIFVLNDDEFSNVFSFKKNEKKIIEKTDMIDEKDCESSSEV